MKKPLLTLTVLSLSLSSIITPLPATAALPLSVGGATAKPCPNAR